MSSQIYGGFFLFTYISILAGVLLNLFPGLCLIALLTAIFAWRAYRGARVNAENIPALIPSMGMNVIIVLATPILLAIGIMIG